MTMDQVQKLKQHLLSGHEVEESRDFFARCCITLSSDDNLSILHIATQQQFYHYEYHCLIPLAIDRLLGKWLKITKYFTIPFDQHFCSLAFLQPSYPKSVELVTPTFIPPAHFRCSLTSFKASVGQEGDAKSTIIQIARPFFWFFVRIISKDDIELHSSDFVLRDRRAQEQGDLDFNLIATSDPTIYVFIMPSFLKTIKDCAKILRQFMKRPERFVYDSGCDYILFCRKHVELTFFYYCGDFKKSNHVPDTDFKRIPDLLDLLYQDNAN